MKRLLKLFLFSFVTLNPCLADNIWFSDTTTDKFVAIFDKHFPDKITREKALRVFDAYYDEKDGITDKDIGRVCQAAGWNLDELENKVKCYKLLTDLLHQSTIDKLFFAEDNGKKYVFKYEDDDVLEDCFTNIDTNKAKDYFDSRTKDGLVKQFAVESDYADIFIKSLHEYMGKECKSCFSTGVNKYRSKCDNENDFKNKKDCLFDLGKNYCKSLTIDPSVITEKDMENVDMDCFEQAKKHAERKWYMVVSENYNVDEHKSALNAYIKFMAIKEHCFK